ncbi:MAG: molybdenum cofactor biosynthesis protein MoaE [Acidobacteriota bacterium]|nr:molybdenum cofactor biosynthesis protein MoaE [Acidobacteriota bacterium]MDQ5873294.1 molybdenum cofactor biosynthesis protein MoaE [Acidobacteriota bacterium]
MFLTDDPIDLAAFLAEVEPEDGAICLFVGVVRNESEGRETLAIDYEAYGPMAESEMARIARDVSTEWPGARLRVVHRVGRLAVGEASVAIVATAPHREEAFAACRAAIDRIKKTVPIWKKEIHPDGTSGWVDPTGNAPV